MMKCFKMLVVCLFVVAMAAVSYAVDGPFVIKNDRLEFPDGSSFATAPSDGRSVLSGSGAPGILTGNIGDFYLDISSYGMYGPYNGTWGTGVSLVGPQGAQGVAGVQGPTGPVGPEGSCSGVVCQAGVPTVMRYMTYSDESPIPDETTTDLGRILTYFPYNADSSGNIHGLGGNNIGVQFLSGTTSGLAVFYFLKYHQDGRVDTVYMTPIKVGGGRWTMTTINGAQALLLDTSAVRHATPDVYFTVLNGNLTKGVVLPGPATTLSQTVLFSDAMLSNKTIEVAIPGAGSYTFLLAADKSASGTNAEGAVITGLTWSVSSGKLSIGGVFTFKIVGGAASPWTVTYTDSRFTTPTVELGPISLKVY